MNFGLVDVFDTFIEDDTKSGSSKDQAKKDQDKELEIKLKIRKLERQIERSTDSYEAWSL